MINGHSTTKSNGEVSMIQKPKATDSMKLINRHFKLSAEKDMGL